jgi:hypothetical protein
MAKQTRPSQRTAAQQRLAARQARQAPTPARRGRRHIAKRGRVVAGVVAAGSFAAITGAMALVDTTTASAKTPAQAHAATTTTTTPTPLYGEDFSGGDDGYSNDNSQYYAPQDNSSQSTQNWGATQAPAAPAIPQAPMTQSNGS